MVDIHTYTDYSENLLS